MSEPKCLLLVGKVRPERRRSLNGMAIAADLPLVSIEESSEAIAWLDGNDPGCVLVDSSASRVDKLIAKIRSKAKLSCVPVLSLVTAPDDLWIEQYLGWGGDDIVPVDAGATLLQRLKATPRQAPNANAGRRILLADSDRSRLEVLARVFGLAAFDVRSVVERKELESSISSFSPSVVVANSALGPLTDLIRAGQRSGSDNAWIVMAARRELDQQQSALSSFERCIVTGVQANPWQILYRANELMRPDIERRREARYQFGSFVLFRAAGSDDDDIGIAYNLSSGGMFVRTFAPVLSDDVWLEWRVPQDKTRVRLEGRVAWRQLSLSDSNRPPSPLGFGVEFQDYLGGARRHLERALEVLDTALRRSQSNRPGSGEHVATGTVSSKPPPPSRALRASQSSAPSQTQPPPSLGMLAKGALGIKPLATASFGGKPGEPSRLPSPPSPTDPLRSSESGPGSGLGTAVSVGADSELQSPAKPSTRTLPSKITIPPRPTGTTTSVVMPPRPVRDGGLVASAVIDSIAGNGPTLSGMAGLGGAQQEPAVRRHDTLREHAIFTDLAEKTDPSGEGELAELELDGPEPTEILAKQLAMLDASEEVRHPVFSSSDDAATVVTNRQAPSSDGAPGEIDLLAAIEPATASPLNLAPLAPTVMSGQAAVGGELAGQEPVAIDSAGIQWTGPEIGPPSTSSESPFVRRRRGRGILIASIVFAVAAVTAALVVIRRSRSGEPSEAGLPSRADVSAPEPGLPLPRADVSAPEPGLPPPQPGEAAPSSSALVAQERDASVPPDSSAGAIETNGAPWAKVDDGGPLEGYPPLDDVQPGKTGRLLSDRYGYLVVRFPEAAFIFSESIAMGATNCRIATPCGEKTLRIGVGEKPTIWLSDEARVMVACRETTQVVFKRLDGVVVPPGAARPIAPGTLPARKPTVKGGDMGTETGAGEPAPERTTRESNPPASEIMARDSAVKPSTSEGRPGVPEQKPRGNESRGKPPDGDPQKALPSPGESPRGLVDTRE